MDDDFEHALVRGIDALIGAGYRLTEVMDMSLSEYRAFHRAASTRKADESRLAMLIARSAMAEDKAWKQLYTAMNAS
ncbi:hypothetical protein [Thiofaba sp. EF100]|uniref:hypothetical protein n=1 Tax=Thiofaba sp. EF100 TaxID=3121274 RepID=UPI0032217881